MQIKDLSRKIEKGGVFLIPFSFLFFNVGSDFFNLFASLLALAGFSFLLIYGAKCHNSATISLRNYEKVLTLFLLLSLFSLFLSDNLYTSLFGAYGYGAFSFLSLLLFFGFFLTLSRMKFSDNFFSLVLKTFLYSGFGLFAYKFLATFFPLFDFLRFDTFELLVVFSLAVLIFLPLYLSKYFGKKERKIFGYFSVLLFFLISLVFYIPLFFLFVATCLLLFFLSGRKNFLAQFKKRKIVAIVFVFGFAFILSLGSQSNYFIKQNNLDFSSSVKICAQSFLDGNLFGLGPGSYDDAFSRYRPSDLNYKDTWQIRFSKPFSFFNNITPSLGFLASAVFLFYGFLLLHIFYLSARKYQKKDDDPLFLSFFSSAVFLFFLPFLTTFTYLTFFLYIFFTGLFISYAARKKYIEFKLLEIKGPYIAPVLFYFLLFVWIILLAFTSRYLIADYYDGQPTEENLKKSLRYNPYLKENHITLSKIYLNRAKKELSKANKDYSAIAQNIEKARDQAGRSIELNPDSALAYESFGIIYRDFANYSSDSEKMALRYLQKAFELEPTNPVLATEIGKLYLLQKNSEKAMDYFNKAYGLKNDYYDASLGVAQVMSRNGNYKEAIDILKDLKDENFNNAKIYFELGRIYYNLNKNDQAVDSFEKSLLFDPNNSNSLYSLAVTYERQGDSQRALYYYEKTLNLNPGNIELIEKVQELKE